MIPRVVAIVPSAGYGKRLGMKAKKPFVLLDGKPLISYTLKTLDNCRSIDAIIIAAEKPCVKSFERLVKKYAFKKVTDIIVGGRTRFESVRNCLSVVGAPFDIVLIHDGARPLVEKKTIEDSVAIAREHGACVVAVPETDTVKLVDRDLFIEKTLDRSRIFRAQTPQAFKLDLIREAYTLADSSVATDDASLLEILGKRVKILEGSYRNIKITTKEDLKIAKVLLCG